MNDETYKLGKDAVELAQDFLDGKVPTAEAKDKMDDIYEKFDELDFRNEISYKKEHHNSMVQIMVLGFTTDLLGTNTDYEMSKKVEADLKELKDYLGLK